MSTNCSVIFQFEDSEGGEAYKGVRVHFDGYPSGVGKDLRDLVASDGVDKVRETILAHPEWRCIDPRATEPSVERRGEASVKNFGEYYTDDNVEAYLLPHIDETWSDRHVYLVTRGGKVLWAPCPEEKFLDVPWREDWSEEGDNDDD